MPVLVTRTVDKDPIKTEDANMETPFSNYKSMEKNDAQGHGVAPKLLVRSGRNSNTSKRKGLTLCFNHPQTTEREAMEAAVGVNGS